MGREAAQLLRGRGYVCNGSSTKPLQGGGARAGTEPSQPVLSLCDSSSSSNALSQPSEALRNDGSVFPRGQGRHTTSASGCAVTEPVDGALFPQPRDFPGQPSPEEQTSLLSLLPPPATRAPRGATEAGGGDFPAGRSFLFALPVAPGQPPAHRVRVQPYKGFSHGLGLTRRRNLASFLHQLRDADSPRVCRAGASCPRAGEVWNGARQRGGATHARWQSFMPP